MISLVIDFLNANIAKVERNAKNGLAHFYGIAETHPILSKYSESRAQCKKMGSHIFTALPRRILYYQNIAKVERNAKNGLAHFYAALNLSRHCAFTPFAPCKWYKYQKSCGGTYNRRIPRDA